MIMSNIFEKSIDMGIGLYSYSKEKIEEFVDELVKKGDLSQSDAKGMVDDLVKRGEKQRQGIENVIKNEIIQVLDFMNIARKKDLVSRDELRNIIREEITNVLNNNSASNNQETNNKGSFLE